MDSDKLRRRELLTLASVGGATLVSGCLSLIDSTTYKLRINDGPSPEEAVSAYQWEPLNELWADHERSLIQRLCHGETVTTIGYRPTAHRLWGDREKTSVQFAKVDGDFYRLTLETQESVTVERWLLWLKEIEGEPPADADIISRAPSELSEGDRYAELSEQDQRAAETAIIDGTIDTMFTRSTSNEDMSPRMRGFVFFEHDPDKSKLVPTPPFTHYRSSNVEDSDYEFVTERVDVETSQYTYSSRKVASSESELKTYIENAIFNTRLSPTDLTDSERSCLQEATANLEENSSSFDFEKYEETGEISESLRSLIKKLDYPTVEKMESEARKDERGYASYDCQCFEYNGARYEATFTISK